jgi:putative ABC transport system permease protein
MAVPLSYSLRNLMARRLTTALTAAGMALVVFVFATVQMLVEGLRQTLVETGSADNVVMIRRASGAEVQSGIDRAQAAIVETQPGIALDGDGLPFASKEVVVLNTLPRRDDDTKPGNVVIRGVGKKGVRLRPQLRIVQGRMFRHGSSEVIAGRAIAERYRGAGLGETLRFAMGEWTVVGVFDAGGSGFDSEIWGDAEQLMQAFRRPVFSSVIVKLADPAGFDAFRERLDADQRVTLDAKREPAYWADQSELMANFIRILGLSLSAIFSIGAVIGAMITMYAAVANRTREIGTMRALGYRKRAILWVFLAESLLLGALGGVLGVFAASFMQFLSISTMNWQSFSELAFKFTLNGPIVVQSLAFALFMGFVGGFLPAARAARLNIVHALRAD